MPKWGCSRSNWTQDSIHCMATPNCLISALLKDPSSSCRLLCKPLWRSCLLSSSRLRLWRISMALKSNLASQGRPSSLINNRWVKPQPEVSTSESSPRSSWIDKISNWHKVLIPISKKLFNSATFLIRITLNWEARRFIQMHPWMAKLPPTVECLPQTWPQTSTATCMWTSLSRRRARIRGWPSYWTSSSRALPIRGAQLRRNQVPNTFKLMRTKTFQMVWMCSIRKPAAASFSRNKSCLIHSPRSTPLRVGLALPRVTSPARNQSAQLQPRLPRMRNRRL